MTDSRVYGYDAAGRLSEVERDGVVVESYSYDTNGNRTSFTGPGGTGTRTYDDQDRLLTYGSASFTYTLTCELAREVVGTDTTYYSDDPLRNLGEVTLPDGTELSYLIDGQDRRVGRKVDGQLRQRLLYGNQLNSVAELDSLGQLVSRFLYGSRINVPEYMVKGAITRHDLSGIDADPLELDARELQTDDVQLQAVGAKAEPCDTQIEPTPIARKARVRRSGWICWLEAPHGLPPDSLSTPL